MKTLQSTIEGTWNEIKSVPLTDEQINLLNSNDEADKEAKETLIQTIESQRVSTPLQEDLDLAKVTYKVFKPTITDTDTYELISTDIVIDDTNKVSGILNCRVNGEHTQVRF